MTVYGPDVSSFQHGLDLSRCADASFVIAKTTEGVGYVDADYDGWRRQARQLGKLFCWYHFLSADSAPAQAAHTLAHVGDSALPGMLDVEPEGSYHPTLPQALTYVDAAHAAGLNLRLVYLPHWYWLNIGSPDLTPFAARGVHLVSSNYLGGSGTAAQTYPGDQAAGWSPYGGLTPLIYQFTDRASDGGQLLDYNAYRESTAQLAVILTQPGGHLMGTIPPSIGQKWPDIASEFPGGQPFDNDTALIWSDGGSRAAALYARQARDAVLALTARLTAPAVDVAALAAALQPLLHAGSTADEVAQAVVAHLVSALSKGS